MLYLNKYSKSEVIKKRENKENKTPEIHTQTLIYSVVRKIIWNQYFKYVLTARFLFLLSLFYFSYSNLVLIFYSVSDDDEF